MKSTRSLYQGHRHPREIISHAVWLYYRFGISFRDVEDLLAERGITVSYETIRRWCAKFGLDYSKRLKRRQGRLGDTWFLEEVFVTIKGDAEQSLCHLRRYHARMYRSNRFVQAFTS